MTEPVDFIDTEKVLRKLEEMDQRMQRLEGALEAIAAALGVEYAAKEHKDETGVPDRS